VLWDLMKMRPVSNFQRTKGEVLAAIVTDDSHHVVSAETDNTLTSWDTKSGKETGSFVAHNHSFASAAFTADGKLAVSGNSDGTITLWDLAETKELSSVSVRTDQAFAEPVRAVAICNGGGMVVSGTDRNSFAAWNPAANGASLLRVGEPIHEVFVTSVALSKRCDVALSGSMDGSVTLWDLKQGKQLHQFTGPQGEVTAVAFSPDGSMILAGSTDSTLLMWKKASGALIDKIDLSTSSDYPLSLAFAPDGKSFLVGTARGVVLQFELLGFGPR
jgi:WD40 repeat protein